MIKHTGYTKDNLKVLGVLIRSKRLELDYSLRDVAALTNISHTLISNIEKGLQTPAKDTLSDIFNALHLTFYDAEDIMEEYRQISIKLYGFLQQQEYDQASVLMNRLKEKEDIYMNSFQHVNYVVLKYLYHGMTAIPIDDMDMVIERYSKLMDFFSDIQKQLFTFTMGLHYLNNAHYNRALDAFYKAITIGESEYDVYIKEYMVICMVRQFKFMDAFRFGHETAQEFEKRTIYIRAMKTKLQIARVYYMINKKDLVEELLYQVEQFASKYEIDDLIEESLLIRSAIALQGSDFSLAEQYVSEMPDQKSLSVAILRFKIAYMKNDYDLIEKTYNEIMTYPAVIVHPKIPTYFTIQAMYKLSHLYNDEEYYRMVRFLCNLSVENNDQEIIGIAYTYLVEYYKSKRQYKNALNASIELLQVKKIWKGSFL